MNYVKLFFLSLISVLMVFSTTDVEAGDFIFKSSPTFNNTDRNSKSTFEFIEARRGGGSRSFGGRSSRSSRSRSNKKSFGNKRSSSKSNLKPAAPAKKPSFGGTRMSASQAKAKYGTPRKTSTVSAKNSLGNNTQYRVNNYGGFSSGLMMGYMTGQMTSMMWMGSLFYSRPVYVTNENGMTSVYPPTFSFTRLLIFLIVIYVVYRIIKAIVKSRKPSGGSSSGSFG